MVLMQTLKPISLLREITHRYTAVLWVCLIATLLSGLIMLSVPFNMDAYDEWVGSVMTTILIIIGISSAICIRYVFGTKSPDQALSGRAWTVIFVYPLAITALMLPWLLTGVLADDRTSILMSVFLWVLLAYGTLLLGFLLVPFVIVPLELVGRGVIALVQGKREKAGPMLLLGMYIILVTTFCIIGAFSLDDVPPGRAGWGHIIFALLGLPGAYTIESPLLLWIARAIGIILIAVPLTLAARSRSTKELAPTHPRVTQK